MRIMDRYAGAVNSPNLSVSALTIFSDTDVLAAFAIADRRLSSRKKNPHPLAVPLTRLFMGDDGQTLNLVQILSEMLRGKAPRLGLSITDTQAIDLSKVALAWCRNGACRFCGGHGKTLIPGTKTLSDEDCIPCLGAGKIRLEDQIHNRLQPLVRWVIGEIEQEMGVAGPEAMKALAPKLDL